MRKLLRILLSVSLVIGASPSQAREWVDVPGPTHRGKALSLQGLLMKPEGAGPFPAVVILHGCQGLAEQSDVRWARRFNELGYAALMVDSFRPRGYLESCNLNVTQSDRARDAYAAKRWLEKQAWTKAGRIGLFGISHGGFGALTAVNRANYPHDKPFRAVAAIYPWCVHQVNVLGAPLHVMIGDADEVTPKDRCEAMKINHPEGHEYTLSVLPGATHFFDVEEMILLRLRWPNRDTSVGAPEFMAVEMRHHPEMAARAWKETRAFFRKYLD